ncbi:hypothetical protein PENTCL1PPCAC_18602, partial [Pristionchus entomophagus]
KSKKLPKKLLSINLFFDICSWRPLNCFLRPSILQLFVEFLNPDILLQFQFNQVSEIKWVLLVHAAAVSSFRRSVFGCRRVVGVLWPSISFSRVSDTFLVSFTLAVSFPSIKYDESLGGVPSMCSNYNYYLLLPL